MNIDNVALKQGNIRSKLKCPSCGDTYLHQYEVEVFVREAENAEQGLHTTVNYDDGVCVDESTDNNPSGQRDGIMIRFWCELCEGDNKHTLCIAQHKGEERTYWLSEESRA